MTHQHSSKAYNLWLASVWKQNFERQQAKQRAKRTVKIDIKDHIVET